MFLSSSIGRLSDDVTWTSVVNVEQMSQKDMAKTYFTLQCKNVLAQKCF